MMVFYYCCAVRFWHKVPLKAPQRLISDRERETGMLQSSCIEVLKAALQEIDTGSLVRSCVESMRLRKDANYNVFARRPSGLFCYKMNTTWLIATGRREAPANLAIHPMPDGHRAGAFFSLANLGRGDMSCVALQLQHQCGLWTPDWAVTGTYCLNHGYYDAYWRLRHGLPWATHAGVLGADLCMPGQHLGEQQRGIRRRGVRSRLPYCMPLSTILQDLLLHSAAQILVRLECLSGRHTAFLLVELTAPSHQFDTQIVSRSRGVAHMYNAAAAVQGLWSARQGKLKQD